MDDMNYKPNSHKYKEEQKAANDEKRAEKVVQGKVKVKKKGEVRKFADVFVAEDAHNVKDYLITEVAIPAIKNTIIDLITNGVTMLFNDLPCGFGTFCVFIINRLHCTHYIPCHIFIICRLSTEHPLLYEH